MPEDNQITSIIGEAAFQQVSDMACQLQELKRLAQVPALLRLKCVQMVTNEGASFFGGVPTSKTIETADALYQYVTTGVVI